MNFPSHLFWILVSCSMILLLACGSATKDYRSSIIGMEEAAVYECAQIPDKTLKRKHFDLAILSWKQPKDHREIAGSEARNCEARLKIVNGKVTALDLKPKSATISKRHPACYALFENCLPNTSEKFSKGVGTGLTQGLMDGLMEGLKKISEAP